MAGRRAYGAVRSSFLFRIGSDIIESGLRSLAIRNGMLQRRRGKCESILKDSFLSQAFNNGFRELLGSVPVRIIQRVTAVLAWFFPRNFRLRSLSRAPLKSSLSITALYTSLCVYESVLTYLVPWHVNILYVTCFI